MAILCYWMATSWPPYAIGWPPLGDRMLLNGSLLATSFSCSGACSPFMTKTTVTTRLCVSSIVSVTIKVITHVSVSAIVGVVKTTATASHVVSSTRSRSPRSTI